MVSDWTNIESMNTDGDNHADLFGGDLFSDELLDIYNSSEGTADSQGHDGVVVPLANDMPQILDQSGDGAQMNKDENNGMGYGGLGELNGSSSMNDFASILEDSPTKAMDSMLLSKSNNAVNVVQAQVPVQVPMQQQQQHLQLSGNKRSADTQAPLSNPIPKKTMPAVVAAVVPLPGALPGAVMLSNPKVSPQLVNKGNTTNVTSIIHLPAPQPQALETVPNNVVVQNNVPVVNNNIINNNSNVVSNNNSNVSKDAKVDNDTPDPLILQAQNAMLQKAPVVNQTKFQPPVQPTVQLQIQAPMAQPAQVPSSYQNNPNTPRLVAPTALTTTVTNPPNTIPAPSKVSVAPSPTPTSSASIASAKTEESFKGVAQAAVNNLILSAGQNAARFENGKENPNFVKPVDTSTAHVAALTSNNWVAACAASISDAPPGTVEAAQAAALAAASDPAAAKAARARRATLTADERARQNRDRNREHARNTRLRKKAYVEELKRTLTELVTARDATELERRHEKQRELEVREVRYRVMEEFLKLRARGSEANLLARWVAILEEGFALTIPKTDYRGMVNPQNFMSRQVAAPINGVLDTITDPTVQVLRGATECFDDASKIAVFLQSMATGNVVQAYNCDRKKFMMDGINAMLEWTLTTHMNGENSPSITLKGCMRATFSPASNKLVCAELLFDSGSVVSQMKSLVSYQDMHLNPSGFSCIAETDALLDSVLPQAPPVQSTKQEGTLPCSVSVVSTDRGETSSDEECLIQQQNQIQCKQEPSD